MLDLPQTIDDLTFLELSELPEFDMVNLLVVLLLLIGIV